MTKYTTLLIPVIFNPITHELWSFSDLNKFIYWYKKSIHNKIVEYQDELELEHKKTKSEQIKEQLANMRKVISSTVWLDMPNKDEYNQRHSKQYFVREWAVRLYNLIYYVYWIPRLILLFPITIGIFPLSWLSSTPIQFTLF